MVTVTDVARGVARSLTTDGAGQYVATSLNPGTYTVRAEVKGFKAEDHSGVLVEVGEDVRVDLTLQPGEQTQTVTVTSDVPAIDTTSSTLGGTVSNSSINALPLNGRNFFRLLELRPGVVTQPGLSSASSSTNGRRLGADVMLVEGLPGFDLATANNIINGSGKGAGGDSSALIPIDAVQEFNTQQNAQAEYGWRDGSVINVGVKSGTNSLHGSGWAFGRDAAATDAANFYTHTVTPATLEQFGGTAGGRIIKDKLFWFASFEGLRVQIASINSITIPSDIALSPTNANLSLVDACTAAKTAGGVNALSAQLVGLNASTCAVTPASSTVENVFPFNPTTTNLFFPGNPASQPLNNGLAKVDFNLNQHNHLSGFYFVSKSTQFTGGTLQPYWASQGINNTQEVAGSWTWTPNSTWVNDLRVGMTWDSGNSIPGDTGIIPANPYPAGYSLNTGVTNPEFGGFPTITFNNGIAPLGVGGKPGIRGPQGQFDAKDSVSYLRGNHAFKFGFEHVVAFFDDGSLASVLGAMTFTSLTTYLQGTPSTGNIITGNPNERLRERWYSGFVEDTWRISHNVTLTPGLRYEYNGPPHSVDNRIGTFDPTSPTGLVQVGPGLAHPNLYNAEKYNFSPRLGLAWDIRGNGRTVLRAGASRLSAFPSITAIAEQTPFAANSPDIGVKADPTLNQQALLTLSFTGAQLTPAWNTTGPVFPIAAGSGSSCTIAVPCGTGAVDPNFKETKSINWNLDLQRAITNRLTLDVAYVGNHGYNETRSIDLNAVPLGTGFNSAWTPAQIAAFNLANAKTPLKAADAGLTSNQICIGQAAAAGGDPAGTCTENTAAIIAARPFNAQYPWLNYIVRTTSGFHSNYNGLQVTVDQRVVGGVSFLAAYTYSHALDQWSKNSQNSSMVADPANPQAMYGNSDYDIRHRFRFSPSWAIPGKKSPGQMLQGWVLSGVLALQGGFAWGAIDQTKDDFIGTLENANTQVANPNNGAFQYWNYSGPTSAFKSTNIPIPCYNGVNGKIAGCSTLASAPAAIQTACTNAAVAPYGGAGTVNGQLALQSLAANTCYIQNGGVLTPPAYGTNGNSGRNSFYGPGFHNVDVSVSKTWSWKERYSAQFRAEFFNAFNHPTLGPATNNPTSDPSKGITGGFGYSLTSPDSGNAVLGSGGPRHIQFGLKLAF